MRGDTCSNGAREEQVRASSSCPTTLWSDSQGKVYVTDRENRRIEIFDSNGRFLTEWPTIEGVSGLFITKDQQIWAGGVLLNLKGEIVGRLPKASAAGGHVVAANDSGDVY